MMNNVIELHQSGYSRHRLYRMIRIEGLDIIAPVIENATSQDMRVTYAIISRLNMARNRMDRLRGYGHWSYDGNVHAAIQSAIAHEWEIAAKQEQALAQGKAAGVYGQD